MEKKTESDGVELGTQERPTKDVDTKTEDLSGPPAPTATPFRTTSHGHQALRRLQNEPPPPFEGAIDMVYMWKEHAPDMTFMDMMRKLLSANHNMNNPTAIIVMKDLIREARLHRVTATIIKMGLDKAEDILGLKNDDA